MTLLSLPLLLSFGASFFQLGISADMGSQGSQSLLQPTQLTTQTAKWPEEERSSYQGSGCRDEHSGQLNTDTEVDFTEVSSCVAQSVK